jgi:hypothetical protein
MASTNAIKAHATAFHASPVSFSETHLPASVTDTDGTDGGQDDDVTEHFRERFAAICEARGFAAPEGLGSLRELVDALAMAVGADFAGFDEWEHSHRHPTVPLTAPGRSFRSSKAAGFTVIDGGRRARTGE